MTILDRDSQIGFIGAGMVGRSLAAALSNRGYKVTAAASRTHASAEALAALAPGCAAYREMQDAVDASDFVFITSTDDAIGAIASSVTWREGQGVVHCSGVSSLDALESAAGRGALTGAIHPLQTFSSVDDAQTALPGTTFAIEGGPEMRSYLAKMALALGGSPIFLRPEDKPLYHATVVMMGGLLSGMFGHVGDLWSHLGMGRGEALKAITPIAQGVVTTVGAVGIPQAVAGPYVRGDVGTIEKHLDALRSKVPGSVAVYCQMALAGLPYALEKGKVPENRAAEIRRMLTEALEATRRTRTENGPHP